MFPGLVGNFVVRALAKELLKGGQGRIPLTRRLQAQCPAQQSLELIAALFAHYGPAEFFAAREFCIVHHDSSPLRGGYPKGVGVIEGVAGTVNMLGLREMHRVNLLPPNWHGQPPFPIDKSLFEKEDA